MMVTANEVELKQNGEDFPGDNAIFPFYMYTAFAVKRFNIQDIVGFPGNLARSSGIARQKMARKRLLGVDR
jgi:hypothetical protein